jgi:hypothetical protein
MLDAKGEPRPELFVKDMLHMNEAGYAVWKPVVGAALRADGEQSTSNIEHSTSKERARPSPAQR